MVVRGKGHKARFSLSIRTYYPIAEAGGVDEGHFFPPASLARSGVIWAIGTMGTGNRLVHG
jgi:hypothetical protein